MVDREKILDRIKKLLKLKEGAGTEHEAATAAACAAKLMADYDVVESDLPDVEKSHEPVAEGAIHREKKIVPWLGTLASAAAHSFGCKMYYKHVAGGNVCWQVVGRQRDIEATSYLYQYLVREVDRLADSAWKRERMLHELATLQGERVRPLPTAQAWKNSFRLGAATTIRVRVKDARREAVQAAAAASAHPDRAIVHINRNDQAVLRYYEGLHLGKTRAAPVRNLDGYHAGREAGHKVDLGNRACAGIGPGAERLPR